MLFKCSKKLVKFFYFIRICFSRALIIAAVLAVGTALLSAYSLINFVNSMAVAYKGNPGAGTAILILLIAVPAISYAIERGLSSYLQHK
jgi:hypothetical protein